MQQVKQFQPLVERAKERKNITIFENYIAIDLITLHKLGHQDKIIVRLVYMLNEKTEQVHTF
jgi:L-aspartate oxidase